MKEVINNDPKREIIDFKEVPGNEPRDFKKEEINASDSGRKGQEVEGVEKNLKDIQSRLRKIARDHYSSKNAEKIRTIVNNSSTLEQLEKELIDFVNRNNITRDDKSQGSEKILNILEVLNRQTTTSTVETTQNVKASDKGETQEKNISELLQISNELKAQINDMKNVDQVKEKDIKENIKSKINDAVEIIKRQVEEIKKKLTLKDLKGNILMVNTVNKEIRLIYDALSFITNDRNKKKINDQVDKLHKAVKSLESAQNQLEFASRNIKNNSGVTSGVSHQTGWENQGDASKEKFKNPCIKLRFSPNENLNTLDIIDINNEKLLNNLPQSSEIQFSQKAENDKHHRPSGVFEIKGSVTGADGKLTNWPRNIPVFIKFPAFWPEQNIKDMADKQEAVPFHSLNIFKDKNGDRAISGKFNILQKYEDRHQKIDNKLIDWEINEYIKLLQDQIKEGKINRNQAEKEILNFMVAESQLSEWQNQVPDLNNQEIKDLICGKSIEEINKAREMWGQIKEQGGTALQEQKEQWKKQEELKHQELSRKLQLKIEEFKKLSDEELRRIIKDSAQKDVYSRDKEIQTTWTFQELKYSPLEKDAARQVLQTRKTEQIVQKMKHDMTQDFLKHIQETGSAQNRVKHYKILFQKLDLKTLLNNAYQQSLEQQALQKVLTKKLNQLDLEKLINLKIQPDNKPALDIRLKIVKEKTDEYLKNNKDERLKDSKTRYPNDELKAQEHFKLTEERIRQKIIEFCTTV